jgi:rsbT co-antagonist protein RsbR
MQITNLDARLRRMNDMLSLLLEGDFDAIDDYGETADDPLGRIEETVQFLIMDIKTITVANRDKEASLLLQQEQLAAKTELLESQQRRIQQQARDLGSKAEIIDRQAAAIRELSTPILEVWDDVLVLPLIGVLDTQRSIEIVTNLLDTIVRTQAKWVIIDVTGVEVVDTSTGAYLIRMVRAAGLLGASCLLSGIQPAVAQTLVEVGVDLSAASTKRNLQAALEHCRARMQGNQGDRGDRGAQ